LGTVTGFGREHMIHTTPACDCCDAVGPIKRFSNTKTP
jgi:hypothetical protein